MDLISWFLCCYVSISMVVLSQQSSTQSECRQCKPGYYASRLCSETHDTICSPCAKDTFTSHHNHYQKCSKCSKCKEGEFMSVPCSSYSDTLCESCSSVSDVITESFLRDCDYYSDSPYSVSSKVNDSKIKEKETNDARTLPVENNVVYEGSGVPSVEEKDVVYDIHDEINETIEGSGEIHFEPDTLTPNQTTSVPVPVIPDESEDKIEEIITTAIKTNVSQTPYPTTKFSVVTSESTVTTRAPSTTLKEGVIIIDSGIILQNKTDERFKTDVVVTQAPTKASSILTEVTSTVSDSTTIKRILVDPDKGITIPNEATTKKKGLRTGKDYDVIVNEDDVESREEVIVVANEPKTGASKTKNTASDGSGVSVGVFVAVCLICAAVFFVLGLLVNKYWANRRARTFNVEEAEKQNGKTFHGGTIEFKDPENNITTKTGIYDEIPIDKQNGKDAQPIAAKESASKEPVYSKPVKRTENKPVNKAKPESSAAVSDKAPNLEKPVNEDRHSRPVSASIKYIDDEQTDDERETDKLLPQGDAEDNTAQASGDSSARTDDEKDDAVVTEVTPMISKDNDTINV